MRGQRKVIILVVLSATIIGALILSFIIETRTPVKYAVLLENVAEYPNSILVRRTGHTGTGWE